MIKGLSYPFLVPVSNDRAYLESGSKTANI